MNSDVTNFEDVDEDIEEEGTERGSIVGTSLDLNEGRRPEVASPLKESLQHLTATPLRVCHESQCVYKCCTDYCAHRLRLVVL